MDDGWLQRFLRSLGEGGAGQRAARVFAVACVAALAFVYYASVQFRGLHDAEAMEYAQLGRSLAEGRGFTTRCIRPADLYYVKQHAFGRKTVERFPDIRHAPLYPALLATGFTLTGQSYAAGRGVFRPEVWVVVPFSILCLLGAGAFLFLAARRLFDARVAGVATAAFFVSDAVLAQGIVGTPVPLMMLLATAATHAALVAVARRDEGRAAPAWIVPLAVSALLCVLGFWAGYAMVALVPALAVFVSAGQERRMLWAGAFVAVFVVGISPWIIRNQIVAGGPLGAAPYAAVGDSSLYPANAMDEELVPSLNNWRVARAIRLKLARNLPRVLDTDLRGLGTGLLACCFLVSFFHRFEQETANRLRWCLALGLGCLAFLVALRGGPGSRLLNVFLPFVLLYGAAFLVVLVDRMEWTDEATRRLILGLVLVLAALPAVFRVQGTRPASPYPPYHARTIAGVTGLIQPREVLCTDIPWATAWYGGRISLLRPRTVDDFMKLHTNVAAISLLYLTSETTSRPYMADLARGPHGSWLPILDGKVPEGFPLREAVLLPPDVVLTDRVRWGE